MFAVIFEVHPKPDQWDTYLGYAKMLRPELEQVDGFVDNIRYKSLTPAGWIVSLSNWRDEKSVVRWRTRMRHHEAHQGVRLRRVRVVRDYSLVDRREAPQYYPDVRSIRTDFATE